MNKLKITNKTGFSNDTKVWYGGTQLDCVSKIEINDMYLGTFTSVKITFESITLNIECEESVKQVIDLIPKYNELPYKQVLKMYPDATIFVLVVMTIQI